MKYIFVITIFLSPFITFGQSSVKSGSGYSVEIPEWLNVKGSDETSWGGTMPAVEGIENAILITSYEKNKFKSFEDFQHIFITGNKFGEETLYSKEHIWYGRNEYDLKQIKNGVRSRVFILYKDHIYHNDFVLLETSKSYLFIQFCSTPETYDTNLPKFNKFLKKLKVQ